MSEVTIQDDGGDTLHAIDVGGFIHPSFSKDPAHVKRIFESVPNFKCREDDVMLCTFPKTGKTKD